MTSEKDVQVARKKEGGGGEVIWAMPERKHSFLNEVFPKSEGSLKRTFLGATAVSANLAKPATNICRSSSQ